MKKILLIISSVVSLLAVFLTDCKKKPELKIYLLEVSDENVVATTTNATITATYSFPTEIRDIKVVVGDNGDLQNPRVIDADLDNNTLSATIDNLAANTKYYYCFRYSNGMSVVDTDKRSFTTQQLQEYAILLSSNPIDGGTVTGGGLYQQGQSCTVSAIANSGYTFTSWTENDSLVSTDADYTFTVKGNRDLIANFVLIVPAGVINGLFTINDNGSQIYFSQGNLQYQATTKIWRFATNQWDYVGGTCNGVNYGNISGCSNNSISYNYGGWIDLFGWGTSGWNNGNAYYKPWLSYTESIYYGPLGTYDLTDDYANSDWGYYNPISNGGNTEHQWRTLTGTANGEWYYIINRRNTLSGIRFAKAQVNDVDGVILLPDNWNSEYYKLNNTNNGAVNYSTNIISLSDWLNSLEVHGAVFLPAAGSRYGTSYVNLTIEGTTTGYYWSVSCSGENNASSVMFLGDDPIQMNSIYRSYGLSVRLVKDAQ